MLYKRQGTVEPQLWNMFPAFCVNLRVGIIPSVLKFTVSMALHRGQKATTSRIDSLTSQRALGSAFLVAFFVSVVILILLL